MLNFPVPYPDELIFSIVARARVHMGITSPKQVLDEVYGNRKVIATVDLPCHLKSLSQNYPKSLGLGVQQLAYLHTLFPVYAPFVPEGRRQACLEWMAGESYGAIHMALGVAASRIKQTKALRYCPRCLEKQLAEHGEYYWMRQWQVVGADCCLGHGSLQDAQIQRHNYHRHTCEPPSPKSFGVVDLLSADAPAARVAGQVIGLLALSPAVSPTFGQWSAYYQELACQLHWNRGKQIEFDAVKDGLFKHWSANWLIDHDLYVDNNQAGWLRSIFRKHRKSFSYLEHIVVLDACLPAGWQIGDVIKHVSKIAIQKAIFPLPAKISPSDDLSRQKYRDQWLGYLYQFGVKLGRSNGGGAYYTWLYRHDKDWLLTTNKLHALPITTVNNRVDWIKRDRAVVRQLIQARNSSMQELASPRRSKNWFLSKINQGLSVEKGLNKLPLTQSFFSKYCEGISDYQVRRIKLAIKTLRAEGYSLKRWRILRKVGLSDERLTEGANMFLTEMVMD